jgi:short-subunit dehydrogenase
MTGKETMRGTAIVTGASAGLGKIYAERLAKRGYDLILVARRKDRLEQLADVLTNQYGIRAEALVADLSLTEDVNSVAERSRFLSCLPSEQCRDFKTGSNAEFARG